MVIPSWTLPDNAPNAIPLGEPFDKLYPLALTGGVVPDNVPTVNVERVAYVLPAMLEHQPGVNTCRAFIADDVQPDVLASACACEIQNGTFGTAI